jgi:anti-sigma factor RsiW
MDGIDIFARTGRLTDLALELYELDELDQTTRAQVDAHLAATPEDATRLAVLRTENQQFHALPIPDFVGQADRAAMPSAEASQAAAAMPTPANKGWSWASIAVAAVAVLVVGVNLFSTPSGSSTTGAAIGIEHWSAVGAYSDDRREINVTLQSSVEGYWMLVQMAASGEFTTTLIADQTDRATRLQARPDVIRVPSTKLDAEGSNQLYAIRCSTSFGVGDITPALLGATPGHPTQEGSCSAARFDLND